MSIPGFMPKQILTTNVKYTEYEQIRFTIKQSWNTSYRLQLKNANLKLAQTPFRAVNNAGDILSRKNYSCGGTSQATHRSNLHGLKSRFGAILSNCDGTNIPPATCNPTFVYDSSDYVKYLKQKSLSNNYNDISFGGDNNNASQSAIKSVRL
jgi:hypothetical protein